MRLEDVMAIEESICSSMTEEHRLKLALNLQKHIEYMHDLFIYGFLPNTQESIQGARTELRIYQNAFKAIKDYEDSL